MKILLVGDYPDDPRLGSGKVYHKLAEEFRRLGHACDTVMAPEIGGRPANARVRWALGPWVAERAVRRAFRAGGGYDVIDVASAEGEMIGARRKLERTPRRQWRRFEVDAERIGIHRRERERAEQAMGLDLV